MSTDLFERFKVIDVDTHLTEPPDVWTARMPASLHDKVPHIERVDGRDTWMVNGESLGSPGYYSMAGFDGLMPLKIPETYDEFAPIHVRRRCPPGVHGQPGHLGQILYPNVGGSATAISCASATGRWWRSAWPPTTTSSATGPPPMPTGSSPSPRCRSGTSTIPGRNRAVRRAGPPGHQLLQPAPGLRPAPARAPALGSHLGAGSRGRAGCQLHVGGGNMGTLMADEAEMGWLTNFAKISSLIFLDNMRCIADLIFGGVCHRFPNLQLVSVESGAGWIPPPSRPSTGSGATAASIWSIPSTTSCPVNTSSARSTAASGSNRPVRWPPSSGSPTTSVRDRLPPPHLPAPRSGHTGSIPPRLRPRRTRRPERRPAVQGAPRQRRPGIPPGLTQSTSAPVR